MAAYSHLLALKAGLSEEKAEFLRLASPMHDVGKIGIPDAILNKPGKLSAKEFNLIKTHPTIGYDILKNSKQRILKTAAIIALQHHEAWDGSGYPQGLSGEDIHIFARYHQGKAHAVFAAPSGPAGHLVQLGGVQGEKLAAVKAVRV